MDKSVPEVNDKSRPIDLSRAGVVRVHTHSGYRSKRKREWDLYTPHEWIQWSLDEIERGESAHCHSDRFSDDWTTNWLTTLEQLLIQLSSHPEYKRRSLGVIAHTIFPQRKRWPTRSQLLSIVQTSRRVEPPALYLLKHGPSERTFFMEEWSIPCTERIDPVLRDRGFQARVHVSRHPSDEDSVSVSFDIEHTLLATAAGT